MVKTGNLDQATGAWYIKNFEKKWLVLATKCGSWAILVGYECTSELRLNTICRGQGSVPLVNKYISLQSWELYISTSLGMRSCLKCIVYSRQRVRVLDRRQIQPAVIHTEPGSAVFFSHQHHRCRPRAVARLDLSAGKHLFYADFLLFNLLGRHTPRSTPDRWVVTGINGVFHSIRVSGQGRTRYGKEVHELQQCISQLAFL